MASITLFEISADPFSTPTLDILSAHEVEIIDDDAFLQGSDGGLQLDVSGVPGFSRSSQSFQVFETYAGEVDGNPVTFILLQFTNPRYMVVTSGDVGLGDTISGVSLSGQAPATQYDTLPSFVCFTTGSMIRTPSGLRRIETLRAGDAVTTADRQTRTLRWVGRRRLSAQELRRAPQFRPVRIPAGSLAPGYPVRDLLVSPQHRIAVTSALLELYFDTATMLAPAKGLIDGQTITQIVPDNGVEYIHLLFDQHELVNVEGVWSESFYPGDTTLDAMAADTQRELFDLFPDLQPERGGYGTTVLPVLKPREVMLMQRDFGVPA